jgi:putative ABC transport system permease protein
MFAMPSQPSGADATFDARQGAWLERVTRDLAHGLRLLARNPGFAAAATVSLALGIGANTAIFTLVDAVLNRPLPFHDPDRLVMLWERKPAEGRDREGSSPGTVLDWQARSDVFDYLAAFYSRTAIVADGGAAAVMEAEVLEAAQVTADFFPALGVSPALGRWFTPDELAAGVYNTANRAVATTGAVILSQSLWQRRFGGDPAGIGRTIAVDGVPRQIVGVMPATFGAVTPGVQLWLPWDLTRGYAHLPELPRDWRFLQVVARLKPGVALGDAQARMETLAANLGREHPATNAGWSVRVTALHAELVRDGRATLLVLLAAVAFLLLLTSVNLANLQLARAVGRRREMAVRRALGAARRHVVGQLLAESLVLALIGGVAGVIVAAWLLQYLTALLPPAIVELDRVAIDARILGFALLVTLATAVLFGLVPAWRGSGASAPALREGSGDRAPVLRLSSRRLLVVAEVAGALVLLAGAALLATSLARLRAVDPGFRTDNVLVLRASLNTTSYNSAERRVAYFDGLRSALAALPGVESVGATTVLPMSTGATDFSRPYWRSDRPRPEGSPPPVDIRMVLPGYVETMGMRVLSGRDITNQDRADAPFVVLVNQRLARLTWPGEDPVGRQIVLDYQRGPYPYTIIGVVNDTQYYGARVEPRPEVFIPYKQNPYPALFFVAHTAGNPQHLVNAARAAAGDVDRVQPVHAVTTMAVLAEDMVGRERLASRLIGAMAAVALLLAVVGIYGVIAYAVSETTRDIGVRMALGAEPGRILRAVLGQALLMVGAGLVIGLVAASVLTRGLASLLYGVSATDPRVFGLVAGALLLAGLAAAYLPSRRAMRVDPAITLRAE